MTLISEAEQLKVYVANRFGAIPNQMIGLRWTKIVERFESVFDVAYATDKKVLFVPQYCHLWLLIFYNNIRPTLIMFPKSLKLLTVRRENGAV